MSDPVAADEPTSRVQWHDPRVILVLPAVVLLLLAGYVAITRFQVLNRGNGLAIAAVRVTTDRYTGHCPSFPYNFTGVVSSNGAGGRITYQWIKPDGTTTTAASASIPSGDREWRAKLQFTLQGQGQATGDAILRVITPTDVKSPPAHIVYQCP